jgi:hypothetical protein
VVKLLALGLVDGAGAAGWHIAGVMAVLHLGIERRPRRLILRGRSRASTPGG